MGPGCRLQISPQDRLTRIARNKEGSRCRFGNVKQRGCLVLDVVRPRAPELGLILVWAYGNWGLVIEDLS